MSYQWCLPIWSTPISSIPTLLISFCQFSFCQHWPNGSWQSGNWRSETLTKWELTKWNWQSGNWRCGSWPNGLFNKPYQYSPDLATVYVNEAFRALLQGMLVNVPFNGLHALPCEQSAPVHPCLQAHSPGGRHCPWRHGGSQTAKPAKSEAVWEDKQFKMTLLVLGNDCIYMQYTGL